METKIRIKKEDILKVKIEDENGNDTGNYLEFDLQDIALPLKIQQLEEEHKKNLNYIKMSFALIDKKQDHSGKKVLSSNEEEKIKVLIKFYEKEMEILDLVLGKDGTKKLLNGREPYYEMFNDIMEYLEPLKPYFKQNAEETANKLIEKYKTKQEEPNVIEG